MVENAASPPSDEGPPRPPQRLGRYRLQDVIGRGAMGVVYRAYDPIIDRLIAIKTIRLDVSVEQDEKLAFYERFFREAQTAGKLSHPNIVTIHDIGEDNDVTFIAMELIDGISLQRYQDDGSSLTLPQVLEIVREVAIGLDYAHQKQIIHRDVKPGNIMLLKDDRVKITDFGIAKIQRSSVLTHAGVFLGSPNYMSPEQVTGKSVDARSDIFSLGTVFYELVTGKKPFQGDHVAATIYNVANLKPPPPRDVAPDLPAAVSRLAKRALQKNADARYQSGREFASAIDEVLADMGVRRATPVQLTSTGRRTDKDDPDDASIRFLGHTVSHSRRRVMDGLIGAMIASGIILTVIMVQTLLKGPTPVSVKPARAAVALPAANVLPQSIGVSEPHRSVADLKQPEATEPEQVPPTKAAPRMSDRDAVPPPSPPVAARRRPEVETAAARATPSRRETEPILPRRRKSSPAPRAGDESARNTPSPFPRWPESEANHGNREPEPASRATVVARTRPTPSPAPTPVVAEARPHDAKRPAAKPFQAKPPAAKPPESEQSAIDRRSEEFHRTQLLNQFVEQLQNNPSPRSRLQAAENLSYLKDDRAVPYLKYSAASDAASSVRKRCRKILSETFEIDGE